MRFAVRTGFALGITAALAALIAWGQTPQDITIKRTGNASSLNISYDKRIPFMYNIDFLLHFEKSVALQGNVEG